MSRIIGRSRRFTIDHRSSDGTYEVKEEWMKRYLSKVKHCIKGFTMAKFHQILKEENMEANNLAKAASADELVDDQIKVQYIPSIELPKVHQIDGEANMDHSNHVLSQGRIPTRG